MTTATASNTLNREAWLHRFAYEILAPIFAEAGHPLPDGIKFSCSWPSHGGLGKRKRVLGQCWHRPATESKPAEIFISPALDDVEEVSGVLVHEVVHAVAPRGCGHRGGFRRIALLVGLVGNMPQSLPGPDLQKRLNALIKDFPAYPHHALSAEEIEKQRKKQTTRMLKVECPECGYTLRTTQKWVEVGLPVCCCGADMECQDIESEEGDE